MDNSGKKKAANLLKAIRHPWFSGGGGGGHSRVHLPVAPAYNIQCNYCVRKYDRPNESRPGVTARVLSHREASERYLLVWETPCAMLAEKGIRFFMTYDYVTNAVKSAEEQIAESVSGNETVFQQRRMV
ncbi:MAG: hypothetical protein LBP37_04915 [Spirochaetaceae bacterium]|jgi:hypothetical protein|nr:hypothetical protein [Spirochaetaceae bacterium]